jgi:hypothetical protein
LLALSCFVIPALSQRLTIGAKGGLRLTGDTPQYGVSDSKRYLVGPMLEVSLPFHFAFEADALYSRLGNTFYIPLIANEADIRTIANAWQFPLLAKYRVTVSRVSPFASIGLAPRYASGRRNTIHYGYYPGDVTFSSVDWHAHDRALVLGAGIGIRTGHISVTPELRYPKWNVPRNPGSHDLAYYLWPSHSYEVQFLVGIGWSM